ncbi:hypothetical protein [Sediminibacterium goheungense]|uniref:Outer membrane protein with beta-barrel domain n=1 Tax=Sediminibacterium goheungense TaxID=1086393 RepID=A0A4R6ITW4_9BACT|nr:hypothetical protein [Sediminibacterium goheungense]TDO25711.1 hypothetical protein BC659_2634 [Sediminibacterium goheungense]
MKLNLFALCLLFTIGIQPIFAQRNLDDVPQPPARSVFGEIGGPCLFSANYDQRFKGQKGWGFRVGMGGIGFLTSGVFAVPVGFNHLSGSDGHYLELGAGASAITVTDGESFFENSNSTVFGYLNFGYRYQPEKKGFTARVFISPLITGAGVFPFYGGISAGFKF